MNDVSYDEFVKGVCSKVSMDWINESKRIYIVEAKKLGYDLSEEIAMNLAVESFNDMLRDKYKN